MEKISNKKALLTSLGELINKKIEVVAQKKDHLSLEDDAVEHAKAYRMLGWSWDQIDTILEDMEFDPDIVKNGIKRAQKYFEETTKEGAFSMFVLGQLIKLKNGYVGKLIDKYPTKLQVKLFDGGDEIMIGEHQIDLDASLKLKEAFALRATANELLKVAKEDLLSLNSNEKEDGKIPTLLACIFNKITEAKKTIEGHKEPLKGNKQVLSALGLEHNSLSELEESLKILDGKIASFKDVPEFSKIFNTLASTAEVLDSFKQERSILASHTVSTEQSGVYASKIKSIIATLSQDIIPEISKLSETLQSQLDELEKDKTAKKVSAVLKKVNRG